MRGTVTFLKEKTNSPNREARIYLLSNGNYSVANLNMPYLGTINAVWSRYEFVNKLKNKEISIKWDK